MKSTPEVKEIRAGLRRMVAQHRAILRVQRGLRDLVKIGRRLNRKSPGKFETEE